MVIFEAISDYIKDKGKQVPGLGYVVTVITFIAAIALNRPGRDLHFLVVWGVWLVAFLCYYFSGILDDIIFEPLYGIKDDPGLEGWRRKWFPLARRIFLPILWIVNRLPRALKLAGIRGTAANKLNENNYLCKGIYGSAKKFFGKSDEWEENVKLWLDISKAARAFILPLFILLLFDLSQVVFRVPNVKLFLNYPILNWLGLWYIALMSLFVLLISFLWFRLLHMVALYDLIVKSKVHRLVVPRKVGNIEMLHVGTVIIPTSELPIYTDPIRRTAQEYVNAINSRDLNKWLGTLTDDVEFLPPDHPLVSGKNAVRAWAKETFFDPFRMKLDVSLDEIEVLGDTAHACGRFTLFLSPTGVGRDREMVGKFINIFRRESDGAWRYARAMFN